MDPKSPQPLHQNAQTISNGLGLITRHLTHQPYYIPYPERLSASSRKWIDARETLKIIVEKPFDEFVIENLGLGTIFGRLGWESLLCISGD